MHFCEELTCGLLVQPANAVSSLAFCLVGAWLFTLQPKRNVLWLFPLTSVLVGITSFLYHASWTFFFQVFDLSSMFMLSSLLLSFNAWRLGWIAERRLPALYAGLLAASIAVLLAVRGRSGEWIFAAEVTGVLVSEAALARTRRETRYGAYGWAAAFFFTAFAVWQLDIREIVCSASNHWLQGHAAWHVLNSACFYFLWRFYGQFVPETAAA